MRLHIVARGRIGRGPEAELTDTYLGRIRWPVQVTELGVADAPPARSGGSIDVALDERGTPLSSRGLAERLGRWRDEGVREARFTIGAAGGLSEQERGAADLLLGFGPATWPHLLVRAMLAEQLFRATAILANHPYPRDG